MIAAEKVSEWRNALKDMRCQWCGGIIPGENYSLLQEMLTGVAQVKATKSIVGSSGISLKWIIIIGVVILGLLALYQFVLKPKEEQTPEQQGQITYKIERSVNPWSALHGNKIKDVII